jgi:hypothetical protein
MFKEQFQFQTSEVQNSRKPASHGNRNLWRPVPDESPPALLELATGTGTDEEPIKTARK